MTTSPDSKKSSSSAKPRTTLGAIALAVIGTLLVTGLAVAVTTTGTTSEPKFAPAPSPVSSPTSNGTAEPPAPAPLARSATVTVGVDPETVLPDSPSMAPADDTVKETFAGTQNLIIETTPGNTDVLVAELEALGVDVTQEFGAALDGAAVAVTEDQLAAIRNTISAATVSVDHETVIFDTTTTQDPAPWNLDRADQLNYSKTSAPTTFIYPSTAGSGVTVFIIDSGFTRRNSELDGRVTAGKDFAGGDHGTPSDSSDDTSTIDCNGHGTHVAGTVGSTTYGVAKRATIVPVRVFSCDGSTSSSTVIAGINWAVLNKPATGGAVINLSLGTTGGSATIDSAVQNAINAGITVVAAAGNGGSDNTGDDACFGSTNSAGVYENGTSPARVLDVITVGATGFANGTAEPAASEQDVETYFSNYGVCVDMFAPGWNIPSLDYRSVNPALESGTSMASPLIAGVAALFLGDNPTATPTAVRAALSGNAATGKITYAETFWPSYISGYPTRRASHTPNLLVNTEFMTKATAITESPTELRADQVTPTSIQLSWLAPTRLTGGEITDYLVQYRENTSTVWLTFEHPESTALSNTVTGLAAGQQYFLKVAAVTAEGPGAYSSTLTAETRSGTTSAPRSLAAGAPTVSSIPLTWLAPTTLNGGVITDYVVRYRPNSSAEWVTFDHAPKATPSLTITGLGGYTSLQFQVAARTAHGDSAFTASVTRKKLSGITSAARSFVAGTATATSVPLGWVAPSALNGGRIIDYLIQYRVTGTTDWFPFEHSAKTTVGQRVTGLSPSTAYQFRIAAQTLQGNSTFSAVVARTTRSGITSAARSFVAGTATATSVPLGWVAPSALNGGRIIDYLIQYRVTGTTDWFPFEHSAKTTVGQRVTGLSPSTAYQFRIAAQTLQGNSTFSAVVARTTRR